MNINYSDSFAVSANTLADSTFTAVREPRVANAGVAVYPNPTHHELTIEAPEHADIELSDMLGRVVREKAIGGLQSTVFDMTALPSGAYILRVVCNGGYYCRMVFRQ